MPSRNKRQKEVTDESTIVSEEIKKTEDKDAEEFVDSVMKEFDGKLSQLPDPILASPDGVSTPESIEKAISESDEPDINTLLSDELEKITVATDTQIDTSDKLEKITLDVLPDTQNVPDKINVDCGLAFMYGVNRAADNLNSEVPLPDRIEGTPLINIYADFGGKYPYVSIPAKKYRTIKTGIILKAPEGYIFQVVPYKKYLNENLTFVHSPIVLTSEETKELEVDLYNIGNDSVIVNSGEKIAVAFIVTPVTSVQYLQQD